MEHASLEVVIVLKCALNISNAHYCTDTPLALIWHPQALKLIDSNGRALFY